MFSLSGTVRQVRQAKGMKVVRLPELANDLVELRKDHTVRSMESNNGLWFSAFRVSSHHPAPILISI
jgi:hypothetical protein